MNKENVENSHSESLPQNETEELGQADSQVAISKNADADISDVEKVKETEENKIHQTEDSNNMEIHHHSHSNHSNTFKARIWEFLMLFLAVFCGFLSEYYLEHIIENERCKGLAKNLYGEVLADSINIGKIIQTRKIKENDCLQFANFLKTDIINKPTDSFFKVFAGTFVVNNITLFFEPKDGVLNQLINSGSLRYFHNDKLQSDITSLGVAITNIRNRQEREVTMLDITMRPFQIKHLDFRWLEKLTKNGRYKLSEAMQIESNFLKYNPQILNKNSFNKGEAENIALNALLLFRATRQIQYQKYLESNHQLLNSLREVYNF